jgi:ribosomal protein S18 acetylase RimI-like enzyme
VKQQGAGSVPGTDLVWSMSIDTSSNAGCSNVRYRICRPPDLPICLQIETASYPPDEAASETSLRYRQENATPYFICAVIPTTESMSPNEWSNEHEDVVIGFICGTRCHTFTHDSMTVHVPDGAILAIHSVVVAESYRRRGIASQMLQHYVRTITQQQHPRQESVVDSITTTRINKIVLLAKAHLLSFYVNCGFQVM